MEQDTTKTTTDEAIDSQELIQKMQLTSDLFFSAVLEDREVCEEFINIITGLNLEIAEVKNQYAILNLAKHSIVMDIYGKLVNSRLLNLEMHPQSGEDRVKRIRYNISSMDVDTLKKSTKYKEANDIYTIYITQADFSKTKKVVNHVIRTIEDTSIHIPNGIHEYYVCLSGTIGTEAQLSLMQYIKNSHGITESKYFPKLVNRVQYLKRKEGGQEIMCELFDEAVKPLIERTKIEYQKQGLEEGRKRGEKRGKKQGKKQERKIIVLRMLEQDLPEETICTLAAISKDEIQKIKCKMC